MNGYSDKLIAIDDAMVALGRPPPPVVSWLSRGLKGTPPHVAHKAWRAEVEAWEDANPEAAVRWLELRQQYIAQEQLEQKARFDADAWNYEQLRHVGCPDKYVDFIRVKTPDTLSWKAARDWLLDGTVWSLVLVGGTGCGKSVAAAWAAHQKLMRNFGVAWVDCAAQCEAPMYGTEAELRRFTCRTAQVLVLDDIAHPRQFERKEGPWLAWLDDVVGARANEGRRTVLTTNRSAVELRGWLGERLFDRLREGTWHSSAQKSMRGSPNPKGGAT